MLQGCSFGDVVLGMYAEREICSPLSCRLWGAWNTIHCAGSSKTKDVQKGEDTQILKASELLKQEIVKARNC